MTSPIRRNARPCNIRRFGGNMIRGPRMSHANVGCRKQARERLLQRVQRGTGGLPFPRTRTHVWVCTGKGYNPETLCTLCTSCGFGFRRFSPHHPNVPPSGGLRGCPTDPRVPPVFGGERRRYLSGFRGVGRSWCPFGRPTVRVRRPARASGMRRPRLVERPFPVTRTCKATARAMTPRSDERSLASERPLRRVHVPPSLAGGWEAARGRRCGVG